MSLVLPDYSWHVLCTQNDRVTVGGEGAGLMFLLYVMFTAFQERHSPAVTLLELWWYVTNITISILNLQGSCGSFLVPIQITLYASHANNEENGIRPRTNSLIIELYYTQSI